MRCEDVREHLADYLTLPADLPAPVMEHVTACGDCKNEFAALFDLWDEMGRIPTPTPDSAVMRARFNAAMAESAAPVAPLPAKATPWWHVRTGWTLRVAALAASVLIVAFVAVSAWEQPRYAALRAYISEERGANADLAKNTNSMDKSSSKLELLRPAGETAAPASATNQFGYYSTPDGVTRFSQDAQGRGGQVYLDKGFDNIASSRPLSELELDQTRNSYENFAKRAETQMAQGGLPGGAGRGAEFKDSWGLAQRVVPPAAATIMRRDDLAADRPKAPQEQPSGEDYDRIIDNPFIPVSQEPLATFSTDVDTASYANVRRFLNQNQLPPKNAVRIEELINYFRYSYPQSSSDHPITASVEVASAPWNPEHRLVRIGLKAKDVRLDRQPTNLVFLVDVSGSMSSADKLPLLKSGLKMLTAQLTENDKVTIVTYAGTTGIALPATNGLYKNNILQAIDGLNAQGSTNGGSGIQMAYAAAVSNFIKGGVNRVILATDGDFNVGITSTDELVRLVEEKAKSGVFLSVLGFGTGNLKDATMEKLADRGNGNYAYIDSINEARKVLVDDIAGTLVTVAKDVKIQVEFNPAEANAYRLIGYENRALAAADFANDARDAGDMGAGHTVTALFEVVPRGVALKSFDGEPLRFQPTTPASTNSRPTSELLNLKIRYKQPDGATSKLIEFPLIDRKQTFEKASPDFRFAASVAAFGMILRDSRYKGSSNWDMVKSIAQESRNQDRTGARDEFIRLAGQAQQLSRR